MGILFWLDKLSNIWVFTFIGLLIWLYFKEVPENPDDKA